MRRKNLSYRTEIDSDFLKSLQQEKIKTQAERAKYVISKLFFILAFFGIGTIKIGSYWILYLIPFIAIGYDLYIQGSDSSIKKIGSFIRTNRFCKRGRCMNEWEDFIVKKRDKFAPYANFLFTLVVIIAAAIYIFIQTPVQDWNFRVIFTIWFIAFLFAACIMFIHYRAYIRKIDG